MSRPASLTVRPELAVARVVRPRGERAPAKSRADTAAADVLDIMPVVMDAMRGAMRHQVGETLSVPQFRCLNYIARRPGCSVSAVAAFLGVTLPTASVMVDRLVRAGAVAPRTAVADRRRSELHTTAAGLLLVRQIEDGALGEFAQALAGCTDAELQALQAGLAVLQRAFQPANGARG
jgi:DNA-binding MarR family transcriptional regulator